MSSDKRNISVYMALNSQDINDYPTVIKTPAHNIPNPTEEDYMVGSISRYFVKKINNEFAYETSQKDYNEVDNNTWQKIELTWRISGNRYTEKSIQGIEPFNKIQVSIAATKMPEIMSILANPVQFARFS